MDLLPIQSLDVRIMLTPATRCQVTGTSRLQLPFTSCQVGFDWSWPDWEDTYASPGQVSGQSKSKQVDKKARNHLLTCPSPRTKLCLMPNELYQRVTVCDCETKQKENFFLNDTHCAKCARRLWSWREEFIVPTWATSGGEARKQTPVMKAIASAALVLL